VAETSILAIAALSMFISGSATLLASTVGVPAGAFLGTREFRGRRMLRAFLHALYGLPPVLLGLLLYLTLSKSGPLAALGWLFTVEGMILAQFLLILPFITGLTMSAIVEVDPALKDTARTLGAEGWAYLRTLIREARPGVLAAVMVGFGRAISEVGAVILVGGNIRGETQVLTTAIIEETAKGNFATAVGLGLILLAISIFVFAALTLVQEGGSK
jgi:tungstate transport system permease protein